MLIVCPACASEYALDPSTIGPAGRRVRCASCRESWTVPPAPEAEAQAVPEEPAATAPAVEPAADPVVVEPEAMAAEPPAVTADAPATDAVAEAPVDAAPAASGATDAIAAAPDTAGETRVAETPDIAAEGETGKAEASEAGAPVTIESRDHALAPARPRKARKPGKGPRRQPKPPNPWAARLAGLGVAAAICLVLGAGVVGRSRVVSVVPQLAVVYEKVGLPVNLVGLTFADVSSSMTDGAGSPAVLVVEGRIENRTRHELPVPEVDVAVRGEAGELLYNWSVPAASPKLEPGDGTTFRARLASPPPAGQRVQVTFKVEGRDVKVALR